MDLPSRYSLDPVAFDKADDAMRKAEADDEWPLLHGELRGVVGLRVKYSNPMVEFLSKMCDGKEKVNGTR